MLGIYHIGKRLQFYKLDIEYIPKWYRIYIHLIDNKTEIPPALAGGISVIRNTPFRERARLTQPELAYAIGVQTQTVWRWEHGEREPSLDVIKKLCEILCCTESELFNAGQRPAVNVGLSVSRVGGAAQTKAMKKAAGSIRIDLAQYREMEVFTQFSSDLDDATKKQLAHGRSLMELLKQPLSRPFSMAEQVIILVSANAHIFSDIEIAKIKQFRTDMLDYFAAEHSDIISQLNSSKDLSDDLKKAIVEAAEEFKKNQE